jgi:hypothetical protein
VFDGRDLRDAAIGVRGQAGSDDDATNVPDHLAEPMSQRRSRLKPWPIGRREVGDHNSGRVGVGWADVTVASTQRGRVGEAFVNDPFDDGSQLGRTAITLAESRPATTVG